jgi:hypothetical protein
MNASNSFEAGDLIAVFGGEIGKDGKAADRVSICVVIACGEEDMIVEDKYSKSYSRASHHKVPKNICHRLVMDPAFLSHNYTLVPKVGDLVLSYTRDTFRDEAPVQVSGILYKTTYAMGKPHKSTLLCGGEMKEVSADSLIVLQSKNKD